MAIFYKIYQDNRKNSLRKGKYYARAAIINTVTTADLCKEISHSTTVTEADMRAVFAELKVLLQKHIQNGEKVVIDGVGSFKAGLKTKPANAAKEFSSDKNIVGYRLNYQAPLTYVRSSEGKRVGVKYMFEGATAHELTQYKINKEDSEDSGSTTGQ